MAQYSTGRVYGFLRLVARVLRSSSCCAWPSLFAASTRLRPPSCRPTRRTRTRRAPRSPLSTQWDLSPLFASDSAFEAARVKLLGEIAGLKAFEGKLTDPGALADCLELYFRLHRDANFLTLYADLRQSTAETDDAAAAMGQRSLAAMDELMRRGVVHPPRGPGPPLRRRRVRVRQDTAARPLSGLPERPRAPRQACALSRRRAGSPAPRRQPLGRDRPQRAALAPRRDALRAPRRHSLAEDQGRERQGSAADALQLQPLPRLDQPRGPSPGRGRAARHAAHVSARACRDARRPGQAERRPCPRPWLRDRARRLSRQGGGERSGLRQPSPDRERQHAPSAPLHRAAEEGARPPGDPPL